MAGCRAPGFLGLVLAHWSAEPGPEVFGCGAKDPRASVGLLVGGDGFLYGWLWSLGCPRAGGSPLTDGVRAQIVLGLLLACWWVGWVLTLLAVGRQWSLGWCPPAGEQGWGP